MRLSACITTRNRTQHLNICLQQVWSSNVKPSAVIVSDDSPCPEIQQQNLRVVQKYPGTIYVIGPLAGISANRNNALNAITDTELVIFIDDDVGLDPNFIGLAIARYTEMNAKESISTILSGITCNQYGNEIGAVKLSWLGYFCVADISQAVNIHAAVFPWSFLQQERWDENIFFGYEDAELCLRALKRGYCILHCPELKASHLCFKEGTLTLEATGCLTNYEICVEAARLYVGIKRYKYIFPNNFYLIAFIITYFCHMTIFLLKNNALGVWPEIIYRSNIDKLWKKL
jgi:glycosyltransferase involved in cell wall biosynthesis